MRSRSFTCGLLSVCLVLATTPARAEMVGSAQLLAAQAGTGQHDQVTAFLDRTDVQQQLVALGVSPADAATRVASLTQAELQQLSDRIDQLPAGAGALELVLVILLLLIVLELLGAINIFNRI